jgi:hypothetical protein
MSHLRQLVLATSIALAVSVAASAEEDAALSRAASSALHNVEGLADSNIGVRVLPGGAAVLWGSVRPADAAKAEEVLKGVPGITQVVNTCDPISEPETPSPGKRPRLGPAPAGPALPVVPAPPVSAPVSRATAERRADEPVARLLDPVAVPGPADYAGIERVRRSDPRFARLTFDLLDGRVVIGGSAPDAAAAWDLARQVAPLVGDRDVVVGHLR